MAVKTHALFYKREDGEGANISVQIVHFFCGVQCLGVTFAALYFCNKPNCMIMKRILNKILRYADAIVKRGVDKLIDAIGQNPEAQTESAETPQPQKSMGNDTNCPPQTTDSTTDCGLTEQAITLMDEQCDIRYNVPDRTPEVKRFVIERAQPVVCAIIVCWHAVWPKCPRRAKHFQTMPQKTINSLCSYCKRLYFCRCRKHTLVLFITPRAA